MNKTPPHSDKKNKSGAMLIENATTNRVEAILQSQPTQQDFGRLRGFGHVVFASTET